MPHFKIQQSETGLWYFQLLSAEGSILLTGTKHELKQSCKGEILSVRINAAYSENYELRISPSKDHFFILRSMGSEKIIGISEMYTHPEGCEKAMYLIKRVIEKAKVL